MRVDENVGSVHGHTLNPIDGRGVTQLNMGGHVLDRQIKYSPMPETLHLEVAALGIDDGPEVTVGDEVLALIAAQHPVVLPSHNHIIQACPVPVMQHRPALAHDALADQVQAGPRVQRGNLVVGSRDHDRMPVACPVCSPGHVDLFQHALPDPTAGTVRGDIEIERRTRPVAEEQGRGRFVGVDEAVDLVEVAGAHALLDQAQRSPGFDRGELGRVAQEPDRCPVLLGEGEDVGEQRGGSHTGFVDEEDGVVVDAVLVGLLLLG